MLTYFEANNTIRKYFSRIQPHTEAVEITEALDRTLAEDIISDIDLPPFDNSAMDGYTVRYNENITKWNIIGEISAGNYQEFNVDESSAVSIMTGAKLPTGADTVIPLENVYLSGNSIQLLDNIKIKKGNDIRYCGEDIHKGKIAVPAGTVIKPKNIALAAACGKKYLNVLAPLKIGILTGGDELIEIDKIPEKDQIRSTNLYTLISLIKELKMDYLSFGIVGDEKSDIKEVIEKALKSELDILITTGGVSVGKRDYIKGVLEECGAETIFWKVKVKPGKPLLFSKYNKEDKSILIFGLPGNPASSFVSFNLFVKPFISELYHYEPAKKFNAELELNLTKNDDRKTFIRGISGYDKSRNIFTVRKSGGQSSGNMASLSSADCLIVLEENDYKVSAGATVECIPL
ncbi:MAG: molybdopterin molybdotransferase [Bacteroidota bacterium]|nr:molybdopterin molybdotransferase [Bacteroidota bacterium]